MTNTPANDQWFQHRAEQLIHMEQLKRAELFNGRAAMLGIVIGNASVISLVGVGNGARNLAEGQLSTLGANVLFIVPGRNDTRRQGIDTPKTLVLEDADAIREQLKEQGVELEDRPGGATQWRRA